MGDRRSNTTPIMSGDEKSAVEKVEAFLDKIEVMQTLQDKTGVKKLYIAAASAAALTLFILIGFGPSLLCNFVGFVYHAYASFKSLESNNVNDDRLWLTYWVIYSCFCLVEGFLEFILFWVPFYSPIKLGFLFYLFLPQTKGAMTLYEKFLRPALKPYVTIIDGAANDVKNKVSGVASAVAGETSAAVGREPVKKAD